MEIEIPLDYLININALLCNDSLEEDLRNPSEKERFENACWSFLNVRLLNKIFSTTSIKNTGSTITLCHSNTNSISDEKKQRAGEIQEVLTQEPNIPNVGKQQLQRKRSIFSILKIHKSSSSEISKITDEVLTPSSQSVNKIALEPNAKESRTCALRKSVYTSITNLSNIVSRKDCNVENSASRISINIRKKIAKVFRKAIDRTYSEDKNVSDTNVSNFLSSASSMIYCDNKENTSNEKSYSEERLDGSFICVSGTSAVNSNFQRDANEENSEGLGSSSNCNTEKLLDEICDILGTHLEKSEQQTFISHDCDCNQQFFEMEPDERRKFSNTSINCTKTLISKDDSASTYCCRNCLQLIETDFTKVSMIPTRTSASQLSKTSVCRSVADSEDVIDDEQFRESRLSKESLQFDDTATDLMKTYSGLNRYRKYNYFDDIKEIALKKTKNSINLSIKSREPKRFEYKIN